MEITSVNIKRVEGHGDLVAFADIVINGELTIKGFRVMKSNSKLWVGVPQNKYEVGGKPRYADIVETSEKLKQKIQQAILLAYEDNQ